VLGSEPRSSRKHWKNRQSRLPSARAKDALTNENAVQFLIGKFIQLTNGTGDILLIEKLVRDKLVVLHKVSGQVSSFEQKIRESPFHKQLIAGTVRKWIRDFASAKFTSIATKRFDNGFIAGVGLVKENEILEAFLGENKEE